MDESAKKADDGVMDRPVSRRGLFKYILLGFSATATAAGVLAPIIAFLWPPKQAAGSGGGPVDVGAAADLPVGKGQVYSVNNQPVLVIHAADGFHALSAVCTHLGCIVYWDEQRSAIACPCHAAYFNINGAVVSGPPPAPLPTYQVEVVGGQILVQGG
jgi:cytochrome b6-f complex iron-sulfur subunit